MFIYEPQFIADSVVDQYCNAYFQKHVPHCCEGSIGAGGLYLWCVKYLAQVRRWICGKMKPEDNRKSRIFSLPLSSARIFP